MTDETEGTATPDESTESAATLPNIGDLFNDESPKEASKGATEEVEAKEESEAETTKEGESPAPKEKLVTEAALIGERRRRQAADKRVKELEAEKVQLPDPIEDEEGYANYWKDKASKEVVSQNVDNSRNMMISSHEDYLEKEKVFMAIVQNEAGEITDQSLYAKMYSDPHPAKFVYDHATEQLKIRQLTDPEYMAKHDAEVIEAARKTWEKESKPDGVTAPEVPDLTGATATGSNLQEAPEAATLGSIMKDSPL